MPRRPLVLRSCQDAEQARAIKSSAQRPTPLLINDTYLSISLLDLSLFAVLLDAQDPIIIRGFARPDPLHDIHLFGRILPLLPVHAPRRSFSFRITPAFRPRRRRMRLR